MSLPQDETLTCRYAETYEDKQKLGQLASGHRAGYRNYKLGNKQMSSGMCEERINKLVSINFN